jgi:hypothetical protein
MMLLMMKVPIVVTPVSIVTDVSSVQREKAPRPYDVSVNDDDRVRVRVSDNDTDSSDTSRNSNRG